MLQDASPAERLLRALALSAYVRAVAWQGAVLHAEGQGEAAVIERFLRQLYGSDVAHAFEIIRDRSLSDE